MPGVAEPGDHFGDALWLSTEARERRARRSTCSSARPARTSERCPTPVQRCSFTICRRRTTSLDDWGQVWSQASRGVHGVPEEATDFGAAFQSLSVAGAAPKFIVSADADDQDGNGSATTTASSTCLATVVSSTRTSPGIDSTYTPLRTLRRRAGILARQRTTTWLHDPFPATLPAQWSSGVVVADAGDDRVVCRLVRAARSSIPVRYTPTGTCANGFLRLRRRR